MQPCISQVTTLPGTFAEDVAHYADAGWQGMEVWLTKLEQHLEKQSLADTRKLVTDRGLTLAAASYQGGLLLSQGEERKAHYDSFKKRLEICQYLGIKTLVVVPDEGRTIDAVGLERAVVSLAQAAQWAAGFEIRLALEFRGKNNFCGCLETALALIHQCGEPNIGVNLDVFHYYTGPSKFEDLALLTPERLALVQLCDLAGVLRELATDADRILPGDGDMQLEPLLAFLRQMGYQGWVSLELMNPTLWKANPTQVAEIGLTAVRKMLGQNQR